MKKKTSGKKRGKVTKVVGGRSASGKSKASKVIKLKRWLKSSGKKKKKKR